MLEDELLEESNLKSCAIFQRPYAPTDIVSQLATQCECAPGHTIKGTAGIELQTSGRTSYWNAGSHDRYSSFLY